MSSSASSLPLDDNAEDTGGGGQQEVRWQVVAEVPGLLSARIIADRLQAEGIPSHAWQESVGQAYGMVYGPLGTGFVSVPEEYTAAAQVILAQSAETDFDFDGEEEE